MLQHALQHAPAVSLVGPHLLQRAFLLLYMDDVGGLNIQLLGRAVVVIVNSQHTCWRGGGATCGRKARWEVDRWIIINAVLGTVLCAGLP